MTELIPYLLERKVLTKVWGGNALGSVLGLPLGGLQGVGETWEVYDRPEGASPLRGTDATLADLLGEHGEALLGRGVRRGHEGRFPLLVKYIDAADRLSVQVHPSDAQARAQNDEGKTEAWVVLHAGPQARIVRGLRPGVTREAFEKVAAGPGVEALLADFTPRAGDAVFVPWGTVHAIGPDVVLYEIQQNSDITYRLYDWGRPRETHLREGLAAMRYDLPAETTVPKEAIPGGGEWLVRCELFSVRRFAFRAPAVLGTEGTFKILSVVSGSATLGWRSGGKHMPLVVRPGDTVLVPATTGSVFLSPVGEMTILWSDAGTLQR